MLRTWEPRPSTPRKQSGASDPLFTACTHLGVGPKHVCRNRQQRPSVVAAPLAHAHSGEAQQAVRREGVGGAEDRLCHLQGRLR
jgi:hypothetical protein